ncbi:MAG: putative transcriptional regulator [Chthonomonadales bacterium]|nr:putative transcriptional regulator [Chthonomonadales bacterium]
MVHVQIEESPIKQNTDLNTIDILENLRLRLPDGSLSNATALLFAARPWRFITGAQVKCGRFKGTTAIDFLDERTLEGTVIDQLDEAIAFVTRNTRQAIRITGRPEREIVPEYPEDAVREAITNAICHRDYAASGTVQVRIYDDRLEVWNPATLPGDLTIEQLYENHTSRPRNRQLASAFYRARLIEHWGTGTLRMVRAFEARGLPKPEYSYEMGMFIVRFQSPPLSAPSPHTAELNDRQLQAVEYVRQHGAITRAQYASLTGIKSRQAANDLTALLANDILEREGAGRSSRYILRRTARLMHD